MALEIKRQTLEVENLVGARRTQALVRAEALVPGAGREAIEPLLADAALFIEKAEVQADRVVIEGDVACQAVYRQGEESAVRALRSNDVHCTPVILSTPAETPSHRLGTYYLETGYGIRPSKVIYDRKHSALTEYDFSKVDLTGLLRDFTWLHLSGITPALGPNCAELTLNMLKAAKELGLTVSFDGNFRSTLWSWEEARDYCTACLPYVDVLLGIEPYHLYRDPENPGRGDWKDGVPLQPSYEQQDEIFQAFVEQYPNLKCIARHVRYAHSGSENSLKAFMWYEGHTFESKLFTFTILDRVGGGDAFASGLIYAMMQEEKPMDLLNFAVASSVIKHTIHGDANIIDDVQTIRNLMNMNYDIRR